MKKDILTILDLDRQDIQELFNRAFELKRRSRQGIFDQPLRGRSLGLLFEKPSTRTRLSFETAVIQLGGTPIFISAKDTQLSRNEPVKDMARVLSRYVDALAVRTFSQQIVEEFAQHADIPVINALTDMYHPCQVLSDLLTVLEYKHRLDGLKVAWVGDGNNVAHSWINASAVLGFELSLACPKGYFPDPEVVRNAVENGCGRIQITSDPKEAVRNAAVIYTDVWASMGQESEQQARLKIFKPFQVNEALIQNAPDDVIVMHCLPAHRGEEIAADVIDGPQSVVIDQAENRLHVQKAIMATLMGRG